MTAPAHLHDWLVVSTALVEGALLVRCRTCGALGTVGDPTAAEWARAHRAPSDPYPWEEPDRVVVRRSGPAHGDLRLETPEN